MSDITYIATNEGWLYLCVIIDLYSRKVIGWSMSERMSVNIVILAFQMACMNNPGAEKVLFHSDRGSQYASLEFQKVLKERGFMCSMSRRGNCWDNACSESFFHSLKMEEVYQRQYRTRAEARMSIFEYIEVFYNRQRIHSYLGYLSPVAFEMTKRA